MSDLDLLTRTSVGPPLVCRAGAHPPRQGAVDVDCRPECQLAVGIQEHGEMLVGEYVLRSNLLDRLTKFWQSYRSCQEIGSETIPIFVISVQRHPRQQLHTFFHRLPQDVSTPIIHIDIMVATGNCWGLEWGLIPSRGNSCQKFRLK